MGATVPGLPLVSDGYPEAWFSRGFTHVGPFFTNRLQNPRES